MCVQRIRLSLTTLGLVFLLNSCGELDFTFSSSGTYRVNALVNDKTLNECSLIAGTDEIRPYFAASVSNDPDVTGLMVYLQSPSGKTEGSRVQYILKSAEPFTSDGQNDGEAPEPDTIVTLSRLDNKLPRFNMPPGLTAGPYTMVFQVLGGKEVLHRSDQAVYYLGSAAFTLPDIKCYLPGIPNGAGDSPGVQGSHLIPPGITIMLDAALHSDPQLDPYIVWYNGKKRISEGKYADGAGLILWKVPEQAGFYTIRAEVFPVKPDQQMAGKTREIFLPVSAKVENADYFYRQEKAISQWYKFWGNLGDSRAPTATEKSLVPKETRPIRWIPADGIYGLSIGPEDIYLLPEFTFDFSGEERGGAFLLRFKPLSPGIVFQAFFRKKGSPEEGLRMSLLNGEDSFSLILESGGHSSEIPVTKASWPGEFIPVILGFSISDNLFTVALHTEGENQPESADILLPAPLSGEGNLQFGAPQTGGGNAGVVLADSAGTVPVDSAGGPVDTGRTTAELPVATAILDEFAIINSSGSLPFEAPAQENSAHGETALQENPGSS
ncbi:MAG: hypothetical protein LBP23_04625 [Treponema sp.]|jgi:hypothetical protein|nr:hypothetical protein [Treponema sp.]